MERIIIIILEPDFLNLYVPLLQCFGLTQILYIADFDVFVCIDSKTHLDVISDPMRNMCTP